MKQGRFSLLKWISISPVELRNISEECREVTDSLFLNNDTGMIFLNTSRKGDFFCFIALDQRRKTNILKDMSVIARNFNPLDLLFICDLLLVEAVQLN